MRSKMVFLLALVMGIITTVLFFQYTNQMEAKEVSQEQKATVQVVKAKEKIAENQVITPEVVEVVEVTEENIHPQAVNELVEIEGKFALGVIEPGEILLSHHVKDEAEESVFVSRKVEEGYRAVSVSANMVQTVTNLIEPEDYVDVVLTKEKEGKITSEQIFSNIRVLAVGRKMTVPVNEESTYQEYGAVTLELKPKEAVKLINASETGTIHLTLNPSTTSTNKEE